MENILVAIDFNGDNEKLVDKAAELAQSFKSKIWLVHVAAPEPDFIGYGPGPQTVRDDRAEDLREEHRNLQKMALRLRNIGIEADALLIQGFTVDSILEKCQQVKADLLVIGSHEHGAFYNLFSENTALELFKRNVIPLLVVPMD
jgi:nucleotide-binding universal stress UspA family protein